MRTVGCSTAIGGSGSAAFAPAASFVMRVSPISTLSSPENLLGGKEHVRVCTS